MQNKKTSTPKKYYKTKKYIYKKKDIKNNKDVPKKDDNTIRLNKYIAHSGVCSRREADTFIEAGLVKVNGKIITSLGTKVNTSDIVHYGDEKISPEKSVYILLNKPKNFITTTKDPQKRNTVIELVENACKERVFPVGRLDRNTTGVLLFTNDGDLSKKLTHPKYQVRKIYEVKLDKNVTYEDLKSLLSGIMIDGIKIKADNVAYANKEKDKKTIGIEMHSGKNRIIRRMFEHLEYNVIKLDRTSFAGLTKKNVQRGKYRFLEKKEVDFLKMM